MGLLLIIVAIVALYWRTMGYCFLIDDIVRRWGYLYEIPEQSPDPSFFSTKAPPMRHMFLTLTHCLNVSIIYFLWGWKAAVLFAFHPLAVSCTAWITGGYYQVTTLFTLTSLFFLIKFPGILGTLAAALFFTSALGSTITCVGIPFIFLFIQPISGLILFWPLVFYLFGKRFRTGYRKRDIGKGDKLTWRKLFVMSKVLAYYIRHVTLPVRLAFFHPMGFEYGKDPKVKKHLESINSEFWRSFCTILAFVPIAFYLSPMGALIFLFSILPFTQWKVLGQFIAERYIYLPLVGFSLILAQLFTVIPFGSWLIWPLVAWYAYRSHKYIPVFESNETLYLNGMKMFPNGISNYVNYAERRLHLGFLYDCYKELKRVLEIDPCSFLGHANMAAYWLSINQPERGKYHTQMAIKYADKTGMAYACFKEQMKQIMANMRVLEDGKRQAQKILDEFRQEQREAVNV